MCVCVCVCIYVWSIAYSILRFSFLEISMVLDLQKNAVSNYTS